ncbi:hypothetical protein [Brevibacillus laterosporus]|uniref:Uncharacterized protein n=1 Tax=Brevibacillus laterosporus TaxID=1465 RepID=A0AAP3DL39_BRELA|nr:hypothetical protein [Brevibacillus laterosporus]MCR8982451.1 hypothetical protein [Brevibacillus laterosporus]MCZ0809607.1 hypothetical protein [Brevibacillus laterosporus]MCZ0828140.1 hypothetical protein [Brevibacillus laterosporus]MCZ0852162.1 hypothetical protein [Brevibacillus laterosporus]
MKKIVKVLSVATLLATSAVAPVSAFAATEKNHASVMENQNKFETVNIDKEALHILSENMEGIGNGIKPDIDGYLHIDESVKLKISTEAYELIEKGVNRINALIKSGEMKIVNDELVFTGKLSDKSEGPRYAADWSAHWWGIHFVLDRDEADDLQRACDRNGDKWALISAVGTIVPDMSASKVAAVVAAIFSYGNYTLAKDISENKTRKGVNVDIGWTVLNTNVYPR